MSEHGLFQSHAVVHLQNSMIVKATTEIFACVTQPTGIFVTRMWCKICGERCHGFSFERKGYTVNLQAPPMPNRWVNGFLVRSLRDGVNGQG